MTLLACSFSPALAGLLRADAVAIDRIEVGPWFSLSDIARIRHDFPTYPIHFHDSNLHQTLGRRSARQRWLAYHQATNSPFASFHLSFLTERMARLVKRGWPAAFLRTGRAKQRLLAQIETARRHLDKPILLENMPGLARYHPASQPQCIADVLTEASAGLLLDVGHARIAANWLGLPYPDYLRALPLERLRQLHVHRPTIARDGHLADTHNPLIAEDYPLIAWLVREYRPAILTLEYWRDRDALRAQLQSLRDLLDANAPPRYTDSAK